MTFTMFDSFGDGMSGVASGCEQDGFYDLTDAEGNVVVSDATAGKKLVALRGLDNFIVVDTQDALLICPKAEEQWIKQLVTQMKAGKQK